MRNICIILLSLFLLLPFEAVTFASQKLNDKEKQQIHLLKNYLSSQESEILKFENKYGIWEEPEIKSYKKKLENAKKILEGIKDGKLDRDNIGLVIQEIKNINEDIKIYLKKKTKSLENEVLEEKKKYTALGTKIAAQLNTLIQDFIHKLDLKAGKLTSNEKDIVRTLKRLKSSATQLENFEKRSIYKKEAVQENFIQILWNIRSDFQSLKKLIRK